MKIQKLYSSIILLGALCLAGCSSNPIELTISNDTDLDRNEEVVEVETGVLTNLPRQFVVLDASDNQVPYQITYDGKLIFQVSVPANGSVSYKLKEGKPHDFQTIACGQVYPERMMWLGKMIRLLSGHTDPPCKRITNAPSATMCLQNVTRSSLLLLPAMHWN